MINLTLMKSNTDSDLLRNSHLKDVLVLCGIQLIIFDSIKF